MQMHRADTPQVLIFARSNRNGWPVQDGTPQHCRRNATIQSILPLKPDELLVASLEHRGGRCIFNGIDMPSKFSSILNLQQ
jgi:hypothetical protein